MVYLTAPSSSKCSSSLRKSVKVTMLLVISIVYCNVTVLSSQLTVITENSQYNCELGKSLVKLGAALAGGNPTTIAKVAFSHSEIREQIFLILLDVLCEEAAALCRKTPASTFRRRAVDCLSNFCWGDYYQELDQKAPILSRIATGLVKHNDHRNNCKKGTHHLPGVCIAIAILLKERNHEMCGIQSILSLILFESHVEKR